MRICMILEGCYPYVYGGVSSWTHNYIRSMPEHEFVLWCIGAREEDAGKFKFELPENVKEVKEVFLDSALKLTLGPKKKLSLSPREREAMEKLFSAKTPDWDVLFDLFQSQRTDPISLLMSGEFLNRLIAVCKENYPYVPFTDYFYTIRSMMLPVMFLLSSGVPQADVYHCASTGYAGLLGSLASYKEKKPLIVTEHGIYTREREEELIRADWVMPTFRQQWIDLFYTFSACAYAHAAKVTALFEGANRMQREMGCEEDKLLVIPNGIRYENFCDIGEKEENGHVDIGAVVRIAKIKDIKNMIYAFTEVKEYVPKARLYILGDVDDPEYAQECHRLMEQLGVEDIIFTGVVQVKEYFPKFDFTILTSISEGQPLSVLESFAAGRPVVATDVGCCRELIEGRGDDIGPAGLVVPPMNARLLAQAMIRLCEEKSLRLTMGENGRKRAKEHYTQEMSMGSYEKLYREVVSQWQESGSN